MVQTRNQKHQTRSSKAITNTKEEDQFIFKQLGEEISKPARKNYQTRHVISKYPDNIWSCDLVIMDTYKDLNDGYQHMLNVVDVFSRFAWSVKLKSKTGEEVLKAFKEIIKENKNRYPDMLWTDKGGEFYNDEFKKWCNENNMTLYSTYGKSKSAIVERFNRTLKTRMWAKFITNNNERRWIDMLPKLIKDYNTSIHSAIKMTPTKAHNLEGEDIQKLWDLQYGKYDEEFNPKPAKFEVNDYVRISKTKRVFEKGYEPSWSIEIFQVEKVMPTVPWTYKLKDLNGEVLEGSFYEPEISATQQTPNSPFLVEKVIKTRVIKGKKEQFVKWVGYSDKFNSWITV